jgi:anthranilate phosphoribosyltransferase
MNGRVDNLPPALHVALTGIATGGDLSPRAFAVAFEATVELPPPVRDVVLGSLMTAMMARGPVAAEVVALLRTALIVDMRGAAKEINGGDRPVVILAGSGKKGLRTLNISTPTYECGLVNVRWAISTPVLHRPPPG